MSPQPHFWHADGKVVERRQLKRSQMVRYFGELPPALIGIEACGTAHHWARQLAELGNEVRLIPSTCMKPHVKRQKNDTADAEAICEAVTRWHYQSEVSKLLETIPALG
ncbi:MAG: transposase [Sphingomonadales bacterium]|nr:transposase [Sphingomonadales bacterium]MDE2567999.1 transposase [Sphingomonadales bacterium]